eukprot:TRINITY_DN9173_c0_g1_i6.p1 TRINITY_DN9173_c0_g1~~TRINITY_DN9173_c0_g1_i6.p1  ORF type:complete len:346 (-),score=54.35 TRINITY_DN9173_c0_g1_i6:42-1079(-)
MRMLTVLLMCFVGVLEGRGVGYMQSQTRFVKIYDECEYLEPEEKLACQEKNAQSLSKLPWWAWLILAIVLFIILLVVIRMLYVNFTEGDKIEERRRERKRKRESMKIMQGCGWTKRKESDGNQVYRSNREQTPKHDRTIKCSQMLPNGCGSNNREVPYDAPQKLLPRNSDPEHPNHSAEVPYNGAAPPYPINYPHPHQEPVPSAVQQYNNGASAVYALPDGHPLQQDIMTDEEFHQQNYHRYHHDANRYRGHEAIQMYEMPQSSNLVNKNLPQKEHHSASNSPHHTPSSGEKLHYGHPVDNSVTTGGYGHPADMVQTVQTADDPENGANFVYAKTRKKERTSVYV